MFEDGTSVASTVTERRLTRTRPFRFCPAFSGSVKRSSTCGSGVETTRAWSTVKVSRPGTATSRESLRSTPMGPPSQLSRRTEACSARTTPETVNPWTRRFGS
jgi:hypothetical protein